MGRDWSYLHILLSCAPFVASCAYPREAVQCLLNVLQQAMVPQDESFSGHLHIR
ncbi:hypothetical protein MHPYR_200109 [uncultured Mycobacterium sp.]|uniref:Uncharacterized protein n=1 Tax=uncultured Mycobacterium sp. TaxID=171292 RepID=A0A1Y5P945_9MYCO|nr:hypothetical protein MHPYR_200109 [uncultured Mycobacterium sp.]